MREGKQKEKGGEGRRKVIKIPNIYPILDSISFELKEHFACEHGIREKFAPKC